MFLPEKQTEYRRKEGNGGNKGGIKIVRKVSLYKCFSECVNRVGGTEMNTATNRDEGEDRYLNPPSTLLNSAVDLATDNGNFIFI